ncbi:hypothetical protein BDV18DRAFT_59115 [Aspergillus unguis]
MITIAERLETTGTAKDVVASRFPLLPNLRRTTIKSLRTRTFRRSGLSHVPETREQRSADIPRVSQSGILYETDNTGSNRVRWFDDLIVEQNNNLITSSTTVSHRCK